MIPARRWRTWGDDVGIDRFGVFVPTIMGAGVVMSVLLLLSDATTKLQGSRRRERRTAISARNVALDTAGDVVPEEAADGSVRRWSNRAYLAIGSALGGLAVYGLIGSFWNYWNPVHPWRHIAWIWALSTAIGLTLLWSGIVVLALALRPDDPPPASRRVLVGTFLSRRPPPVQRAPSAESGGDR